MRNFINKVEKRRAKIALEYVTSVLSLATLTTATFSILKNCHNSQTKNAFLHMLLILVTSISSFPSIINTMSRFYSPFSHSSIQLSSCIWRLPTLLHNGSCHTNNQKRNVDHNYLNNYRSVFIHCLIAKVLKILVLF